MSNLKRPFTTVVLAMSADGKISDAMRSPTKFGSAADFAHLEHQVARADGVIVGAGTLRAGGTAMRVINRDLLQMRETQGQPPQPIQIVCSLSGKIDPDLKFFRQPIPRWLLTTATGAKLWQTQTGFDRVLVAKTSQETIDLPAAFKELASLGIEHLAVLGGGKFVAALLAEDLIDELWLTVCPLIFGGVEAPTPVDGSRLASDRIPQLELLEVKTIGQEVFLHYQVKR